MSKFITKFLLKFISPEMIAEQVFLFIREQLKKKNGFAVLRTKLEALVVAQPQIAEYAEMAEYDEAVLETNKWLDSEQGSLTMKKWLKLFQKN